MTAQLFGSVAKFYLGLTTLVFISLLTACMPAPTSPSSGLSSGTVPPTMTAATAVTTYTGSPAPINTTAPAPTVPRVEAFLEESDTMQMKITLDETTLTATLIDGQAVADFVSLLPLTLTLEDYAGTEKVSDLPKRLSTEGAPAGIDPAIGDITYYAPWGNLAIFYRDFGYANGLVLLGTLEGGVEALNVSGPVPVTIELVK